MGYKVVYHPGINGPEINAALAKEILAIATFDEENIQSNNNFILSKKDYKNLKYLVDNDCDVDLPKSIPRHHPKLIEIIESGVDGDWKIKEIVGNNYYIGHDSSGKEWVIDRSQMVEIPE
jgi:hypothetical protein